MARPTYPSDNVDKLLLRFPHGMREKLKLVAEANGRSMNSEVIQRLEMSLSQDALAAATIRTMMQEMLHIIFGERAALREELRRRVAAEIAARPNDSPIHIINEVLDPRHDRKMDLEHFGASTEKLWKIAEYLQDPDKRDGKEGGKR